MKTYFKLLLTLAIVVGYVGVAGPFLISAKSTEAVLLGFVLLVTAIPLSVWLLWRKEIHSMTAIKEID